jgi:hypothetical protein
MGVGGLLLGVRKGAHIRLLDSIDIPCSHSAGPSFDLSADEKRESRAMIAEAGTPGVSGKVGVIGWYCSKTRDEAKLNPSDLKLYDELFPQPWQIALVVRPNVVEAMRAAFFFRAENGVVVKGIECEIDEWLEPPSVELEPVEPVPEPETATMPLDPPEILPQPVLPRPVFPEPVLPQPVLTDDVEIAAPAPMPVEMPQPVRPARVARRAPAKPPVASFDIPGMVIPRRQRNYVRLALPTAAALLAVLALAFMTRAFWMPKPPLNLNTTELNGTLLIRWNPEALRGVDHASMFVNDGGQRTPSLITLDRFQLKSGLLSYTPKSQRVTAKLDAGETSAITAWFAKATPAPATPAQATPAPETPAPTTPEPATPAPSPAASSTDKANK